MFTGPPDFGDIKLIDDIPHMRDVSGWKTLQQLRPLMDTPTRERIEALEARVKELEAEVASLRSVAGAVSAGPSFVELTKAQGDQNWVHREVKGYGGE